MTSMRPPVEHQRIKTSVTTDCHADPAGNPEHACDGPVEQGNRCRAHHDQPTERVCAKHAKAMGPSTDASSSIPGSRCRTHLPTRLPMTRSMARILSAQSVEAASGSDVASATSNVPTNHWPHPITAARRAAANGTAMPTATTAALALALPAMALAKGYFGIVGHLRNGLP
jgi:hypothetical protein